ncbi:MAG: CorA family divalent cation transporter [Fuerstiella sp.]
MNHESTIHRFENVQWLALLGSDSDSWQQSLVEQKIDVPESLTSRTEWPEFHELDDGRVIVSLHFPMPFTKGSHDSRLELKLLIDAESVVMMHSAPLPTLDKIRGLIGTPALPQDASATRLVCHILMAQVDTRFEILDRLNVECDRLEDMIFTYEGGKDFIGDLMVLRKSMSSLSRVVIPQREVVRLLAEHLRERCSSDKKTCSLDSALITRVYARILHVETLLTALRDKANQITEANEAFLTHSLNRTLKLLTGVSVIVAPPTLIAGLWGMNTDVPGQGSMLGFFMVMILVVVTSAATTWFFRRNSWV